MDKLANLIITLKNGGNAGKGSVMVPATKLSAEVAKTLFKAGFIASMQKSLAQKVTFLSSEFLM
jgi:ribosomal protein S8